MTHATHKKTLPGLADIASRVGDVIRMVEEERYCVDILTELRAVQAALRKVEGEILGQHVEHCVAAAAESGDAAERDRKIAEVMTALRVPS